MCCSCSAARAPFSRVTSACPRACTAPATCNARACCSTRPDAEALGAALAAATRGWAPTVVLSPALGGIVIGQEVGRALGVRALFAERTDGALALRRGFTLSPDDRVLVVEDVVTTGGSTRETMEVASAPAPPWSAPAPIVDRSGGNHGARRALRGALPDGPAHLSAGVLPALRGRLRSRQARLAQVGEAQTVTAAVRHAAPDAGLRRHGLRGLAAPGRAAHGPGRARGRCSPPSRSAGHVAGAGRTDAGVHAPRRWPASGSPRRSPPIGWCARSTPAAARRAGARRRGDVRPASMPGCTPAARPIATSSRTRRSDHPALRRVAWHVPQRLSSAAMAEAAAVFVGEHDFAAFQGRAATCRSTVRRVTSVTVDADAALPGWCDAVDERGRLLCVRGCRAPASSATWCATWPAPSWRWAKAGCATRTCVRRSPAGTARRRRPHRAGARAASLARALHVRWGF